MSEKYLPIKIFEKRKEYDDRYTEGGGDNHEPSWVLHGDDFRSHSNVLGNSMLEIKKCFHKQIVSKRKLPMVMATTIKDVAIAKSHRGNIVGMLDSDGNDNVIGFLGSRQLLSIVKDEALLDRIDQIISDEKNATTVSAIDEMEVYQPYVEQTESDSENYRIRLIDYNDYEQNLLVRRLFEQFCKDQGIEMQNCTRFTKDMNLVFC